jgi:hypothetical protein
MKIILPLLIILLATACDCVRNPILSCRPGAAPSTVMSSPSATASPPDKDLYRAEHKGQNMPAKQ